MSLLRHGRCYIGANCGSAERQINVSRPFIALLCSGMNIAYELGEHFQVSTPYGGCARSGWTSFGATRGPPAQTSAGSYEDFYQSIEARRQESYKRYKDFFGKEKPTTRD